MNSKVCIVLSGEFATSNYGYMVFVVDLGSGFGHVGDETDVLLMSPTVRFDWKAFNLPAICVLNSKVYIFEDYHERFDPNDNGDGKTVYTYDLSAGVGVKLEKSMMLKEPPMKHTKAIPKATVTHDGKILVFSSLIEIYHSDQSDFEMYDPFDKIWYQLPNLPVCEPDDYSFFVLSFTFINKSVFFLRTEVGVFTLDLQKNDWVWERSGFRGEHFIPPHRGDTFVVIGKDICVIPNEAFDIGCADQADGEDVFQQLYYTFPALSSFSRSGHSSLSFGITLLEEDDDYEEEEVSTVCFLHTGLNVRSMLPELMLQVYITHIPTCKKYLSTYREQKLKEHPLWWKRKSDGLELPATSRVQSLKIVVSEESRRFNLCSFSSIIG